MKRKNRYPKGETNWSFAIINGRIGEIYFQVGKGVRGIYAHCYINRKEFTKSEEKMIDRDIKKYRVSYRNGKYRGIYPK